MAYTLTPAERRARAQSLRENRENRKLYYDYLEKKAALEREQQIQRNAELQAEQEKANQSFLVRGLSTVGDIVANVLTGAVKGLEGIVDLGIGLVGGIGGIFDGDFQERAKNAIAYDWTGETFGNALQEALKYSYTTNGGIIENVASGIGQMLPSVVVSIATAGAGAPAAVAQAASLATLGVSAAGTSTEEAFQEGADYWAGLGYGAASGLVEVGTEKMFGGATKALTGAGILDGVTRSVADTGIKRIAKNALEEGVEEVVSELANPALKSIYKGSEAFNDYGNLDYWKGVGEAGLVGSLTALAYSGTVGYGLSKVGVGYVGKEADIADSLSEIATLKEKANNLQANGELIGVNEQKIADTTKKNYQNIEKVLQGVSEDKRSKLIEKFNLDKAFNTDGSMSGQLSSWFNSVEESAEVSDGSQNELASLKKDSYSFNLRGQEQSIASDLDAISENLANKYMAAEQEKGNNITIEQAREQVGKVKVFDGEMSDNAKQSRNKFNKALNYLNKESGANLSFVVTESNDAFNGLVIDDRTMYIGEDQFEKGTWAETLVHEYTHLSEGSEEYAKLVDFLSSDNVLVDDGNGGKVELWKKGQESVFDKNYGFDRATIQEIHDKIANDQELTADEQKYFKDFMSEVGAHETQYLLGNEEFIDRIVARDSSFAKKFLQKIENLRKAFERFGDKEARKAYKQIHEAEKLYLKAAAKAGDMKLVRFILSRNPDLEKEIDVSTEIKYNKKAKYLNISKQEYAIINSRIMEDNSGVMAKGGEIARYNTARSANYFYVYENFSEGNFGVLKQIALTDDKIKYINAIEAKIGESNGESVIRSTSELNRVLEVLKNKSRSNSRNNAYDSERRADSRNGELSIGQSESERIGNTEKGDGNKRVKYSLKIGKENLTIDGEERKNLVALHNLSEEKLIKVLELGGFPMPSIAITRADLGHEQFGDITVIFGRETIDPKADSRNKVYSRDGYTPTVPKIDYKVNEKVLSKISKKYYELSKKFGYDTTRPLYKYVNDMERVLEDNAGEFATISQVYDDTDIMQLYLLDSGKEKIQPVYKEITESLPKERVEYLNSLINHLGKEAILEITPKDGESLFTHRHNYAEKYRDKIAEFLVDGKIYKNTSEVFEDFKDIDLLRLVISARNFINNGATTTKSEFDSSATNKAIREATPQKEYHAWVDSLFEGIQEKTGIRNDKDIFTPSGNRRSFEATHDSYTLDNIIKAMKRAPVKGDGGFVGLNVNALAAKLSKEFKSVAEIRKNADSLKTFNQEIQNNFIDTAREMISEIERLFVPQADNSIKSWTMLDGASTLIGEIADNGFTTEKQIADYMAREYKNTSYKYSKEVGDKILALFEYVRQMTDTDYFESKPRRAVEFKEIRDVLIPENASEKLIKALDEQGIEHITYTEKNTRSDIINKLDDIRFSLKEDSSSAYEYEQTIKFSLVEDKKTLDFLNNQKHITVYRAMQVIDGKLYPPMAAKIKGDSGKTSLVEATQLGKWYQADEHPELVVNGKFTLNKGNGSSITAAYNPYWHTSKSPLNDQFSSAYKRNNLVTVECEVPESELTSGYKAEGAKDSVGEMSWHSGQVSSKLSGKKTRKVILSRWVKVNRIVSDSEVASKIAKLLEGEDVSIPDNTVTPSLRSELEKLGVKITESGKVEDIRYSLKEDSDGRVLSESQKEYFKNSKVIDEDGNLMVVYHGTPKPNFSVFKLGDGALGNGIYFAESKEYSKGFSFGSNPYEVYLNITNPYEVNYPISDSITEKLIAKGYDGIHHKQNGFWVAFSPEQIKLVDNLTPTKNEDIRFDLKKDDLSKKYHYELTDGQIKKLIADKTMRKVYSKVESEKIINTILSESLGVGEKYGSLTGRAKSEVIEMLWRGLNTAEPGKQMKVALDVAEYIIQNSVLENLYEDSENSIYIDTINALKPYLHSLDLSALKGEIKYKFDNDNSAYLLWGKRKGEKGLTADQIKMELDERGFFIDSDNEADIFFRMDSAYREAVAAMKKKTKELLSSALSAEERKTLKNNIAREVLIAFDKNGKQSTFSKILEQYHKEALTWKEKYYDERTRNSVVNRLLDRVQKVKDWKLGTFLNASQYKTDIFKKSIDKLANIKIRGDLNQSGTREIVSGLKEWYSKSNPLLEGVYDSEIAEMLDDIATSGGKLTTQELRNLSNVVDYFKHFVETYNKVYRNGKYVEAQPIAEKYVSVIKRNQSVKVGWLKKYFEKYLTTFGDPMTVARYFDKYESGFYSEMLATLRESATKAQIDEMNIREPIEEFIKKNKKYFNEAEKKTVKYQGRDIPLLQAMYVYMAMNDVDTIPSFAKSGFVFNDGNSDVRIDGFAANEDVEIAEMQIMAKEIQTSIEKQFSAADKEYIEIARKIFNEDCRKRFSETSIILKGYTNAKEGDYVPIRRANIAKNVDTSTFEYEVNRASNASFTKDRVKGAKGELRVDGIDTVLDRHIRAVAQYANLAPAIEEYNKLFSLNTGEDNNKPVSVSTESRNLWAKGDEYFKKLISDIQGIPATKGDGIKFMAFIRGGYAKFQLGANPKVWVTQLSSFFAAGSILDYSSIVKGIGIKAGDVDTYCELAKLRNNDNTVAMAQGVLDKIDKVGNVLMKPIGTVDRFVITKLFGACQVQVQKNYGLKIGTEENKVKAGELLKRVILETQQNSMATERSSAMRSGSEFMRTITMFSADSMKVIGRVVDSIGELSALKAKKKILTDANEIANIDKQIKQATKKVAKSTASLITSAVFMALVAQLFRTLYNKDDEEDNVVANMATDAIGNLFGGLPIFKDIYSRLVEGYDIDGYAYSAINDMLDSADNIFKMCGDIVSGEVTSQEVAKNIKNMVYAAGQIFGLPARNVYNVAYGLTKRVSPSTAYKIDTAFYNKKYTSDLNKAVARGDDDMIATIVELMTDERVGDIGDSAVSKELNSLVTKGFDVIPRSVGEKITYNGEEINLTSGQRKQFKQVYSVANKAVASLVKLSQYESASDEVKAKAIKYIYNVYYNLALQDLLGEDLETKTVLFAEAIDVEKLAIIVATANSLTADLDKKGNAISGTRKRKIQAYVNSLELSAAQKYMVMGYLGFSNLKGEMQVKAYINRLNLTKSEKEKLLKYSGYEK